MTGGAKVKLFAKEDVNTGRQFEFDFAKAVCILGMVLVHCCEELAPEAAEESALYFIVVIVLDALFGAGTFMTCMGLGMVYSRSTPDKLIRRGAGLLVIAYVLNFLRGFVPYGIAYLGGKETLENIISYLLCNDILMFAALAMMLYGLLKKWRASDGVICLVALGMSIVGSFARFLDVGPYWLNQILGTVIATADPLNAETVSAFPLLNWFIIVVMGTVLGKYLRRCTNMNKFYAITFPSSAVILAVYMAIAIPNHLGLMQGDLIYYYHMTTFDACIVMTGAVFAVGLYHYIGKILSASVKKVITVMSTNINRVYCIHWVIIGWIGAVFAMLDYEGMDTPALIVSAIAIYVISNIAAEVYRRHKKAKIAK